AARVLSFAAPGDEAERYTAHAAQLLQHLQGILASKPQGQVLVQLVVAGESEAAGLAAMLKSGRHENLKLIGQVLHVACGITPEALIERLNGEAANAKAEAGVIQVRDRQGQREVLRWQAIEPVSATLPLAPLAKDNGLYLITGGAGGLG